MKKIDLDASIKRLKDMNSEQFLEALIKAGICTKKGKLRKKYKKNGK